MVTPAVMRQNLSKRLFLNAPVWKGLKVEKLGDKVVRFSVSSIRLMLCRTYHSQPSTTPRRSQARRPC